MATLRAALFPSSVLIFRNVNALVNNTPSSVQVLGDVSAPNPLHNGATGNRFLKQAYYIFFAQDEWRLTRSLTMRQWDGGVRAAEEGEQTTHWSCANKAGANQKG